MLAELHKSTPEEAKEQRATLGLWLKSLREAKGPKRWVKSQEALYENFCAIMNR